MASPTRAEIEDKLRGEDLNTSLDLWRVEQGPAKPAALKLITAAIPFQIDRTLRVLDVGCGTGDDWRRSWSRVNALLGYDYGFLRDPPDDHTRIGDGLSAMHWVGLLTDAGFESIDILQRDAERVVLASVKP